MRSSRAAGIVCLLLLAPLTAELLQAYLDDLGGPLGLVAFVLFLAPLYGGAGLLIREVCVRTGRGWTARLLLSAAFGVAMATLVDRSLFTLDRADIDGWNDLVTAAPAGGIGWFAATTWVAGHVLLSVTAPTIVAETLSRRPGPWLGRLGLTLTVVGMLTVATLIHGDPQGTLTAGAGEYLAAVGLVLALVALALSPLGRPIAPTRADAEPRWRRTLAAAFVLLLAMDVTPPGWPGLGFVVVVLASAATLAVRRSRSRGWTPRDLAALAVGLMLERLLVGVLNPLTDGTTIVEKYAQSGGYLVLLVVLAVALARRTATPATTAPPTAPPTPVAS